MSWEQEVITPTQVAEFNVALKSRLFLMLIFLKCLIFVE